MFQRSDKKISNSILPGHWFLLALLVYNKRERRSDEIEDRCRGAVKIQSYSCIEPSIGIFIQRTVYIIGLNYHGHYLHAGGLSVNNYVRENKVREVYVRENKVRENIGQFQCGFFLNQ